MPHPEKLGLGRDRGDHNDRDGGAGGPVSQEAELVLVDPVAGPVEEDVLRARVHLGVVALAVEDVLELPAIKEPEPIGLPRAGSRDRIGERDP